MPLQLPGRPLQILIVDDSPADAHLIHTALQESGVPHTSTWAGDGAAALAWLQQQEHAPRGPDLILLDLNMPQKNGFEVIAELRQHPRWQLIPIVVFSSSCNPQDIKRVYELQANCYLVKPMTLDQVFAIVGQMLHFWAEWVQLPSRVLAAP
jgi:two-component system, chemotaxis family, response regulator Rcp1